MKYLKTMLHMCSALNAIHQLQNYESNTHLCVKFKGTVSSTCTCFMRSKHADVR